MTQLLDGKLAPITFSIGFLEKPLGVIADSYFSWTKTIHKLVDMCTVYDNEISTALLRLAPLWPRSRRTLWLATDSPWTAYFDNCSRGPDPFGTIAYLSGQLSCRGLIITCTPNTLNTAYDHRPGTYGAVMFTLFSPTSREFLRCERTVVAMNDGGKWKFSQDYAVQPFEEVERYSARRIQDRFTPDMLERYCDALGIRVSDEKFYQPAGVLIDINDPLPEGFKEVSLAEIRRQLALE